MHYKSAVKYMRTTQSSKGSEWGCYTMLGAGITLYNTFPPVGVRTDADDGQR